MTDYNFKELIAGVKTGKYKFLGAGSSRKVYDLNDGCILKLAKDIRGILQNKNEDRIYSSRKSNYFAEVIAVSDDYRCIVMPKASIIKTIETVCKYYNVRSFKSLIKLEGLINDINNNNLSKNDLIRPSSWGLINGVPMIIDYGLTHEIFRKYYGLNGLFKKYKPLHYS